MKSSSYIRWGFLLSFSFIDRKINSRWLLTFTVEVVELHKMGLLCFPEFNQ